MIDRSAGQGKYDGELRSFRPCLGSPGDMHQQYSLHIADTSALCDWLQISCLSTIEYEAGGRTRSKLPGRWLYLYLARSRTRRRSRATFPAHSRRVDRHMKGNCRKAPGMRMYCAVGRGSFGLDASSTGGKRQPSSSSPQWKERCPPSTSV